MAEKPEIHLMQCLEVWGGNQAVDSGVIMAGVDAWLYSQPYQGQDRGGDVHFVSSCATGRLTRMLVADVSGHGSAVADTATALRRVMRRYMNHIDQGRFVEVLNSEFSALAKAGHFATAVAATYYSTTRELAICTAGHPPPFRFSVVSGEWAVLRDACAQTSEAPVPANIPLGVADGSNYDQRRLRIGVGDLMLLYTDSLIESRDEAGRLLGVDGLLEVVRQLDPAHPESFIDDLLSRIRSLHPTNLATDDVTALLFRPNSLAPKVPFRTRARANWLMLKEVVKHLFNRREPIPWPESSIASVGGAFSNTLARVRPSVKEDEGSVPGASRETRGEVHAR